MLKLEGVYVAMVTPVNEQKSPDEAGLRKYTEFCIARGVDGLFPVSSVGEFIHFGLEDKKRIMDIVHDQAKGRVPVLPGISETHPESCIELGEHAKQLGCQGAVVCPPYFFTLTQEVLERHFEVVADALSGLPIVLYNIPLFTERIDYDVVKRLSRRPNVVGLKDSSGSMVDLMHYIDKVRIIGSDFNVLTGREETFLAALAAGAKGCMTAMSGIVPEVMVAINRAFKEGHFDQAQHLQYSFLAMLRAMMSLPFPVGFKLGLELRGIPTGPHIQPLSQAEQYRYLGVKARIENLMNGLLDELAKQQPIERSA